MFARIPAGEPEGLKDRDLKPRQINWQIIESQESQDQSEKYFQFPIQVMYLSAHAVYDVRAT